MNLKQAFENKLAYYLYRYLAPETEDNGDEIEALAKAMLILNDTDASNPFSKVVKVSQEMGFGLITDIHDVYIRDNLTEIQFKAYFKGVAALIAERFMDKYTAEQ